MKMCIKSLMFLAAMMPSWGALGNDWQPGSSRVEMINFDIFGVDASGQHGVGFKLPDMRNTCPNSGTSYHISEDKKHYQHMVKLLMMANATGKRVRIRPGDNCLFGRNRDVLAVILLDR